MIVDDLTKPCPGDQCLICGEVPAIIGIFSPDEPTAWGGTHGKARLFRYCLCSSCHSKPGVAERTEKIIRAELVGGGVNHA